MENFVNRVVELGYIEETFASLLLQKNSGRTPIYEFHGVGGIGKTWMLRKVEESCHEKHLPYIWADASKSSPTFWHEIFEQVARYQVQFTHPGNEQDWLMLSIEATKMLLSKSPVVILVDSLDATNLEQLSSIKTLLHNLIDDNKLFVVLASKQMIPFNDSRTIGRKLVPHQLKPFDHDNCISYLDKILQSADPEMRHVIFEWTKGYPLAINVLVQEIREKQMDLKQEQDRKQLWAILIDEVIRRGIFSDVIKPPSDLEWYRTILSLLSLPRRSNTQLFQGLIETFAPQYRRSSHLAYMTLHKQINQASVVLDWHPAKSAYAVEASIRNIFMVKLKIEQPDLYYDVQAFLADWNRRQAEDVTGTDNMRYLQEYLYHSSMSRDTSSLPVLVTTTIHKIISQTPLSDSFTSFYQGFLLDEELKLALGTHANIAISLIYKELARLHREIALDSAASDPVFPLREFFTYVVCDPLAPLGDNSPPFLLEYIQQVRANFPPHICIQLYDEIRDNDKIKGVLGERVVLFSFLITDDTHKDDLSPEE